MRARMIGAGLMAKGSGISPGRMPDDRRRRHCQKRKANHGVKPWERPAVAGRAPGDTLLVYASLSSLGWGNGGPVTLIQALLQAVGAEGTAFRLAEHRAWPDGRGSSKARLG
ncbi:AAC(3) family N-acetyltransferase [Bosea lupini]|uniref:AAC(3) family N-acetyltransferase n=1 Tax=Bosea lupini TaxID=1036779 RepID=UPI001AD7FEBF